jgi:LmbE family N-acetylglucosaminyl deacetylase
MKKWILSLLLLLILPISAAPYGAASEMQASEITDLAKITVSNNVVNMKSMTDQRYITAWASKKGYAQFDLPKDTPCYGVYLCFSGATAGYSVQIQGDSGNWVDYKTVLPGGYEHQYVKLPGVNSLRVKAGNTGVIMYNAEIHLIGEGRTPDWVQQWETLKNKADMMLLIAHPDDEFIWFGGTLPLYAGERGLQVQAVYMTCGANNRRNELLDGLWTAGVRNYPVIGSFEDKSCGSRGDMYSVWGGTKKVYPWLTGLLRRYQPDVLLTHDMNGEYGHGAHQAAAGASIHSVQLAAQKDYDPASFEKYGVWQVKKLYLHLYSENAIVMDWQVPLDAFGGRTAFMVAEEALEKHKSQHPLNEDMSESGRFDCRKFGLYMSTVGLDIRKNDFFEHIP